jgi:hypothetical protein
VPEHTREFHEVWWSGNVRGAVPDRAFVDFSAWCWHNWVETGVVEGFYIDGVGMGTEIVDRGNLAYTLPDGHVQPGYGWRLIRQHHKRMRQILWDAGIVPHICNHMTNGPYAPIVSFVDVMLDGEWQYQSPPSERDFLDVWPPDRMRIAHVGKWHVMTKWLGWTVDPPHELKAWTYRRDRAWIANLALHDVQWRFWGTYAPVWAADASGLRDTGTEFVPYWDDGGLADHGHDGLYVCAWKPPPREDRPDACVVLLVNGSDGRIDPATVRLDTRVMGLGDDPGRIAAEDIDPMLLYAGQYETDPTHVETPAAATLTDFDGLPPDEELDPEMLLEEEVSLDLASEEGRAAHPDYRFTWTDRELRCAVRRHDYRLFRFVRK